MKFLNDIQFHTWDDYVHQQKMVKAVLTFHSQMSISDALLSQSEREVTIRSRRLLSEGIQRTIFGDVIEELSGLRKQLFSVRDPSVIPVMDRLTDLIDKLRRGQT